MYKSSPIIFVNGLRVQLPLESMKFKTFNITLKCRYDECKKKLNRVIQQIMEENKKPLSYTLTKKSDNKTDAKLYIFADDPRPILEKIKSSLVSSFEGNLVEDDERILPYDAIENFFDMIVRSAINRAGFIFYQNMIIDHKDPDNFLLKRTVIEEENGKFYGILHVDLKKAGKTIADVILEKTLGTENPKFSMIINNNEYKKQSIEIAKTYIGKKVLTLRLRKIKRKYEPIYGEIKEIKEVTAKEEKLDNEKSIYDLWYERYSEDDNVKKFMKKPPDGFEFPLFKVKLGSYEKLYTYPPSLLKPFGQETPLEPSDHWSKVNEYIERIVPYLKDLISSLLAKDIKTELLSFTPQDPKIGLKINYIDESSKDEEKTKIVKLRFGGSDKKFCKTTYASPMFALSKMKCKPLAGDQNIKLAVLYPDTLNENSVKQFLNNLTNKFKDLNLGELEIPTDHISTYTYREDYFTKSLNDFENKLKKILNNLNKQDTLPLLIIPKREEFYKNSKAIASNKGFLSQLVTIGTFNNITSSSQVVSTKPSEKAHKIADSTLVNICGSIYTEFLIQKAIAEGKYPGPFIWTLAEPADGRGKTIYVGFDISRKNGTVGTGFIVLDSYGNLINAKIMELRGETITENNYYEVFRHMVNYAKEKNYERIVILRDGYPRKVDELEDCLNAFKQVTKDLEYNIKLEYVSVIKSSHIRIFENKKENEKEEKDNPRNGRYVYLYTIRHLGFKAHEIAVVSTKPPKKTTSSKGTTRPVVLRIYELMKDYKHAPLPGIEDIKKIAEEYLNLTRLNFWNLTTGASKLALPVKMADQLSYMRAMGIPISTPP